MESELGKQIDILLEGYKAAKSEQQARIGFRDNLLYVTLAATGAITGFTFSKDGVNVALLAIPWVVLILGWTYVVNDEKISAIGGYIRHDLEPLLQKLTNCDESLFGWEVVHRSDTYRSERKFVQLGIDLLTFAGSGLGAIAFYLVREPKVPTAAYWICGIEAATMLLLSFEIATYADLKRGN
jgi:hypothetical protein